MQIFTIAVISPVAQDVAIRVEVEFFGQKTILVPGSPGTRGNLEANPGFARQTLAANEERAFWTYEGRTVPLLGRTKLTAPVGTQTRISVVLGGSYIRNQYDKVTVVFQGRFGKRSFDINTFGTGVETTTVFLPPDLIPAGQPTVTPQPIQQPPQEGQIAGPQITLRWE